MVHFGQFRRRSPLASTALIVCLVACLVATLTSAAGCSSAKVVQKDDDEKPAAEAQAPETSAQEYFLRGNEALDKDEWKEAIAAYQKAVDQDPERWDAYLNMAIAHSQTKDFEAAVEAIDKALAHGGEKKPEVYFNLGNIYQKRGLYEQAVKAYRTSLAYREDADHVDTLVNIGAALAIMGREKNARKTYEKARRLTPDDPRIQHGLAILYFLDQKKKESIRSFEQLEAMAPDYAPAYFDRAMILARLDRYDEAVASLKTYLRKAPDGPLAHRAEGLLEIYQQQARDGSPQ